ncbi:hypothetical protein P3T76_015194 [Phytophthora citrophthora]|uniref:RxLR effector protein n=1 Tax=Phytophthora citrophthora TaxID=4793 RepID=A0AAD9LB75_9STRA|nr:hypothetical protein P3T76_015194 [Phytophthora citrophthora]
MQQFYHLAVLLLAVCSANASEVVHDSDSVDNVHALEEREITSRLKKIFKQTPSNLRKNDVKILDSKKFEKIPSSKTIDTALSDKNLEKVLSNKDMQKILSNKKLQKSLSGKSIDKVINNDKIKRSAVERVGASLKRHPAMVAAFQGVATTTIVAIVLIFAFGSVGLSSG